MLIDLKVVGFYSLLPFLRTGVIMAKKKSIEDRVSYIRWIKLKENLEKCKTDHDILELVHSHIVTSGCYRYRSTEIYSRESLNYLKEKEVAATVFISKNSEQQLAINPNI